MKNRTRKTSNSKRTRFLRELEDKTPSFSIGTSPITGKYTVLMHCGNECKVISVHYKREDALFGLKQCQACASSFPKSFWSKSVEKALHQFLRRLNENFDYEDDDEILGLYDPVTGDVDTSRSVRTYAMARANSINDKPLFTVQKLHDEEEENEQD